MYTTILTIVVIVIVSIGLCGLSYAIGRTLECFEWMKAASYKNKIKEVRNYPIPGSIRYFKVEELY